MGVAASSCSSGAPAVEKCSAAQSACTDSKDGACSRAACNDSVSECSSIVVHSVPATRSGSSTSRGGSPERRTLNDMAMSLSPFSPDSNAVGQSSPWTDLAAGLSAWSTFAAEDIGEHKEENCGGVPLCGRHGGPVFNRYDGPSHANEEEGVHEGGTPQLRLLSATRASNFKGAVDAIADGAEIHGATLRGVSPLMIASGRTDTASLAIMKFLFDLYADIEQFDAIGMKALHHACRAGNLLSSVFLIEKRADVSQRTNKGLTPLMYCASSGNLELADRLIQANAKLSAKDWRQCSAFLYACEHKQAHMVTYLMEVMCNPADRSKRQESALMIAARNGDFKSAKYVLASNDVNWADLYGNVALIYAIKAGRNEMAEWLVFECSADYRHKNKDGLLPSEIAFAHNLYGTARLILQKETEDETAERAARMALERLKRLEDMFGPGANSGSPAASPRAAGKASPRAKGKPSPRGKK